MTNTEITYTVLEFCNRKSPVAIEEIYERLPHVARSLLDPTVAEMIEAKLLRGTASLSSLMDGDIWNIGPIRGLTFLGEEWLRQFSPTPGTVH